MTGIDVLGTCSTAEPGGKAIRNRRLQMRVGTHIMKLPATEAPDSQETSEAEPFANPNETAMVILK